MSEGGRIGANLADVAQSAQRMAEAGRMAAESSADASSLAAKMEAEVNDLTATLSTHFQTVAANLRDQIALARQTLEATDWDGKSRAEANEAAQELNREVDIVLDRAHTMVEDYKASLLARASEFVSVIDGDFRAIMGKVDDAYQQLSEAQKTYIRNLEAADDSIRFSGGAPGGGGGRSW